METTSKPVPGSRFGAQSRATVQTRPRLRMSRVGLYLAALVLIGLALRLWFVSVNVIDPRFSAADDGDYYQRALRLAATGQYLDDSWLIRPPLHVLVFAALIRFSIAIGDPSLGIPLIRALHIALSLLTIVVGYDLARRLFNRRAGLVFATLLAVWFPMIELPALILSEPIFFYCLLLHMWLLVRWRDDRRWSLLFGSGIMLGISALARSPALYSTAFVALFIVLTLLKNEGGKTTAGAGQRPGIGWLPARASQLGAGLRQQWRAILRALLTFCVALVIVVGPWTVRNCIVYQRFILIDTLGPVNLWLSLQPERIDGGKSILARIPQAERQDFVATETRKLLAEDPWRLTRDMWPHFLHIWKAQFAEDFLAKVSFFTRPLRDVWLMGALGDLIWFVFTMGSLVALATPLREGAFRWLALGWMAYSILIVGLLHVEPRYLLPIWGMMALYGSKTIADVGSWILQRRANDPPAFLNLPAKIRNPNNILSLFLVVSFLWIFFTYRDYPGMIASGIDRETHRAAGARAYAAGDYDTAVREFQTMVERHPLFVDGRTDLALALLAQNRLDEAWAALGDRQTHRADVVRGAIARAQSNNEAAIAYFTDAEVRAGEDIQALTLAWLRPAPTNRLTLGNGLDFGYIWGFSFGEKKPAQPDASSRSGQGDDVVSYRWLQDRGKIVLPLEQPLRGGDVVQLRMVSGTPSGTPLDVDFGAGSPVRVHVVGGEWRTYRLTVPAELAGQQRLTINLSAPTFIPAQRDPNSPDARSLSLMMSAVWVR